MDFSLFCLVSLHACNTFWTSSSLNHLPAGVTQEGGYTGFLIHLLPPSAMHAFIFLARRIQPFLSLIDREVELCVLTISSCSPPGLGILFFIFYFLVRKNPSYPDSNSQRVKRLRGYQLSYRGDRRLAINNNIGSSRTVQYNGRFLPDVIMSTLYTYVSTIGEPD